MLFRKSWPRFALESAIEYNIQHSGLIGGRCVNIGCGTSGRYKELLSNFDTDGIDILEPGAQKCLGVIIKWMQLDCIFRLCI